MSNISVFNCFVLLAILLYYTTEIAESLDAPNDRKTSQAMWFGPRIGRKKRNPTDPKTYINDKNQPSMDLYEALRESPLVVVAVNEEILIQANKQHNFTPRLGRESGETLPNWADDAGMVVDGDTLPSRPNIVNPFAPRLGRNNYNPFNPRLGRDSEMPLQ